jgi:hypothetical protein
VLELKTIKEMATDSFVLASSFNLVRYHSVTYIPADYETLDVSVPPDIDRTIWLPLTRSRLRLLAADQFNTLFRSDNELASFDFMVAQSANQVDKQISTLLVRTPKGLKELDEQGHLVDPSREFRPNTIVPMLNEKAKDKKKIFSVVSEWLGSDEEAESLLKHLATCLSPGWSAVKYVLLLGEGRNGKSVLLKMLQGLFGVENVSNVTRQAMSEKSAVVTELNGKLLNIIYDGQAEYVKDSGTEKSLIAGEPAPIRRLYESTATMVQSNALFIEGLNREPKTSDKSTALQKRLVRFQFTNVYPLDHRFERSMMSESSLGAFLSLLIDRYVTEDEVAAKLAPTPKTVMLQLDSMYSNSMGLQYLRYLEEHDALGVSGLVGQSLQHLVDGFRSWRLKENDLGTWAEPDVQNLFAPLVTTERKTQRVNGQPRKVRVVVSLQQEATAFIESLKGADDEALVDTVVEDG